ASYRAELTDGDIGDLANQPRVGVLNNSEVPDAAEMAEMVTEHVRIRRWPVFPICAVAHKELDELRSAPHYQVEYYRRTTPPTAAERIVLRRRAVDAEDFRIHRDPATPGGFVVTGTKPERWIRQTEFENDEAVGFLGDRLSRLGVED